MHVTSHMSYVSYDYYYLMVYTLVLEKGMSIHSSLLAWRIPRTEEPGGLQSVGSQRIGTRLSNQHTHTHIH